MLLVIFVCIYVLTTTKAASCMHKQHCASCNNDNSWCSSKCYDGYYGFMCNITCSRGCRNNICHLTNYGTDECTDGCKLGFYGIRCNIPCETQVGTCMKCHQGCEGGFCQLRASCTQGCQDSYYGTACRSCPAGCKVCNRISGTCEVCLHCEGDCTHGCLEGCTTGDFGDFGDFCEHTCSSGCLSGCNQTSGDCLKCKTGRFGAICDKQCSTRCVDGECDMDGICTHDCTESWYGPSCDAKCGTGCEGGRCHRNGTCTDECKLGFHGEQCQKQCQTSCVNRLCDIEDICKSCEKGFYGSHCNKSCVRCLDDSCRQDTGICIKGCLPNYRGEFCQHHCTGNCTSDECRDVCKLPSETKTDVDPSNYIRYSVEGAVVLALLVALIYVPCRCQRNCSKHRSGNGSTDAQQQSQRHNTPGGTFPHPTLKCQLDEVSERTPHLCGPQPHQGEGCISLYEDIEDVDGKHDVAASAELVLESSSKNRYLTVFAANEDDEHEEDYQSIDAHQHDQESNIVVETTDRIYDEVDNFDELNAHVFVNFR